MRNIIILVRKELTSYFNSPIAYIFMIAFNLICAWIFTPQMFVNNEAGVSRLIGVIPMVYLFFIPAVTMRLISEETSRGTFELLATLPIRDSEIVIGKYIAALILLAATLASTCVIPASVALAGDLDVGQTAASYLGVLLLGASFLAMGLFASSLTRQDIVAFIAGFFMMFLFYMVGKFSTLASPALGRIMDYIGIDSHLSGISRGVIDSRDLVYFLSLTALFLHVTVLSLTARRWR